ncbi:hypothetical protein DYB25_006333 [Aphanomyces astaci]|uniref:Uncharacterized protein n=1 Tax=Aphanomyces astaci TaxID=112090 RepID=A0A397BP84_APHAT|nr:hypothetical protein DYB25_006333 [Aphanomyces astaci]
MTDEGKKRKASEVVEDANGSVEEAEASAPQVELVVLTAELDDDDGMALIETVAKVKGEVGGPERTSLARDEVFEHELAGVDLDYVRNITRRLTVVNEFDETRDGWGYRMANVAVVKRYLRLFASDQPFELRVLWMLLALEGMHIVRVSFHWFDEFNGAKRELYERDCLERWTVDVGSIDLCNDETLLEYLVAFVWTLVGQGSGWHGQLPLTAG